MKEDLDKIAKKYEFAKKKRNNVCVVENRQYILHLSWNNPVSGNTKYRCKYYKGGFNCQAYAEFDKNKKLISYSSEYSCRIDTKTVKSLIILTNIKKELEDDGNILAIKAINLYEKNTVLKRKIELNPLDLEEDINNRKS